MSLRLEQLVPALEGALQAFYSDGIRNSAQSVLLQEMTDAASWNLKFQ